MIRNLMRVVQTAGVLAALSEALQTAADEVRGVPQVDIRPLLGELPPLDGPLDSQTAFALLQGLGVGGADSALPDRMAPLLALMEALPAPVAERLLTELLARIVEPV